MKNFYNLLIKSTIFTTLIIMVLGCEDKSPINHNPIGPKDTIKDYWINHDSCQGRNPEMWFKPIDFLASSIKRSNLIVSKGMSMSSLVFIDSKTLSEVSLSKRFWDSKRNEWRKFPLLKTIPSCPYDENRFFAPMYSGDPYLPDEIVKDYAKWAIINPKSGEVEEIDIKVDGKTFPVRNQPAGQDLIEVILWLPYSTPGNDYLFLNNNTILHLQKGILTMGISNLNFPYERRISSVSPDGKYAFYQIGTDSYINNSKLELEIRDYDGKLHWSADSKSFVFVSYGENGHNFVYRYSVLDDGNVKLINRINLSNNFCSYYSNLTACFLSDSTLGVCVFKYDNQYGNIYEINFDGTLKRVLTNYTN